jgi:hypothetical protein
MARVYIDLDTDTVVTAPGVPQRKDDLTVKRTETAKIDVQFFRAGEVIALDEAATGIFELKKDGQFDAAPLTGSSAWVSFGLLYSFYFTLINEEIDDLLFVDGNPANDLRSIKLMGEIQWKEVDGSTHKTQTLEVTVLNNVIRTGDVIPGGGSPPDYMIDDTDPMAPEFIIDETSLEPVTAG